jgi:hypothetical protein
MAHFRYPSASPLDPGRLSYVTMLLLPAPRGTKSTGFIRSLSGGGSDTCPMIADRSGKDPRRACRLINVTIRVESAIFLSPSQGNAISDNGIRPHYCF